MSTSIATIAYVILILALFWLDRDSEVRPSKVLWIPVLWFLIAASRPFTEWFKPVKVLEQAAKYSEANPANDVILALLLATAVLVLFARRGRVKEFLGTNGLVILFFLYCGASVLWSDFPAVAFRHWLRSIGDPVMVLVILTEADLPAAITRLITRTAFVLVPLSVLMIKYYPDLGRVYNYWTFDPMYCGMTWNKNSLGLLCLVMGLGSLWCLLTVCRDVRGEKQLRRLLAHAAILVMIFWMFHIADSVTSTCCFALAGGLMAATIFFGSVRKAPVLRVLMLVALSLPLIALFSTMGGGLVQNLGRNSTLTGRTVVWQVVLSVSGNRFLGTGFESFWLGHRLTAIWQKTMVGLQEAHNGYLEVYLNLGLIGISLIAGLIVKGWRNVTAIVRGNPALGSLLLAFFLAAVIYSLTEAGFRMMNPCWITFLLAASATPRLLLQESSVDEQIVEFDNEQIDEFAEPEVQLGDEKTVFPREAPSFFMGSN